ncbi:MAG: 1-acyl-sn-glycerol-3-phosphate acyltransferase [Treponema sp.]|jgi:1-acyl-sn-glycerol-3-phosphate acyltransferase|nr:1-acyl-sn-glycerol-3-phosphate acyltransferase [Treponema sp.]
MIKTILIFFFVVLCVIFLFPFAVTSMILYFLGFRKAMTVVIYRLAQIWARITVKFAEVKVTVTGRENIPKKGGICLVSNHCGFFDIVLLLAYCGRPFGFVAKKELAWLPLFGAWIYLLGGLFIDRKSVKKAIRTINKGVKRIKKGGGMLIFPEGTRSKGRGLLPFHAGSLKLATQSDAVIVPVAIEGSYEVFEKTRRVSKCFASIAFCPPIDTKTLSPEEKKQALADRIYNVISGQLEQM